MAQSFNKTINIILHGRLKKYSSEPLQVSASTVAEAVHAMCLHCPDMKKERLKDRITMQIMGYECEASLYEKLAPDVYELHFFPAFLGAGGKSGGFLQIAIGVALVAVFAPAGLGLLAGTTMGSIGLSMGISLALGGLMQLISPAPSRDSGTSVSDPEASKYLGATVNSTRIGTRIPIVYGLMRCGGHYISFDVAAKDVQKGQPT
jgi:predicted phage tail protein